MGEGDLIDLYNNYGTCEVRHSQAADIDKVMDLIQQSFLQTIQARQKVQ